MRGGRSNISQRGNHLPVSCDARDLGDGGFPAAGRGRAGRTGSRSVSPWAVFPVAPVGRALLPLTTASSNSRTVSAKYTAAVVRSVLPCQGRRETPGARAHDSRPLSVSYHTRHRRRRQSLEDPRQVLGDCCSSRVVGSERSGVLDPGEGEEPYVLSPLVDLTRLDAASRIITARDMLRRGRTKYIGHLEDAGAGGEECGRSQGLRAQEHRWQQLRLVLQQLVKQCARCDAPCGKRYERW